MIGWIAEKAIELGKVETWGPLAKWRKPKVLVNTFAVEKRDGIDEMRAERTLGFMATYSTLTYRICPGLRRPSSSTLPPQTSHHSSHFHPHNPAAPTLRSQSFSLDFCTMLTQQPLSF